MLYRHTWTINAQCIYILKSTVRCIAYIINNQYRVFLSKLTVIDLYLYLYIINITIQYNNIIYLKLIRFSVLLLLDADILHYIESELQIHYKDIKMKKEKKWKKGDLCIAQYHHDKKWYRGRIFKTLGNILMVRGIII